MVVTWVTFLTYPTITHCILLQTEHTTLCIPFTLHRLLSHNMIYTVSDKATGCVYLTRAVSKEEDKLRLTNVRQFPPTFDNYNPTTRHWTCYNTMFVNAVDAEVVIASGCLEQPEPFDGFEPLFFITNILHRMLPTRRIIYL